MTVMFTSVCQSLPHVSLPFREKAGWGILLFLFFVLSASAQDYKLEQGISYRPDATDTYTRQQCRLDIYYPAGKTGLTTVVWFHGGGLTGGAREIPAELKGRGLCVVGVGYRLCSGNDDPKAPNASVTTDDCVDDAAAAAAWVMEHIADYGGDTTKVYLSGHSAGGYLVSMIGLDKRRLQKYGADADRFAAIVPFSGQMITHFQNRRNRGISDYQPLIDEAAPLYYVRKDCPPMLLITGDREREMLGRYEENAYFWRMMKLVGHPSVRLLELEGFDHGSMAHPAHSILLEYIAHPERFAY